MFYVIDQVASGKKMKELRLKKNLKVKDVARELGLSNGWSICRWESGRNPPSMPYLLSLMDLYGVSRFTDILVCKKMKMEDDDYVQED